MIRTMTKKNVLLEQLGEDLQVLCSRFLSGLRERKKAGGEPALSDCGLMVRVPIFSFPLVPFGDQRLHRSFTHSVLGGCL